MPNTAVCSNPPLLSSPQLSLRALEPEDLDLLYTVENDTSLWPYGRSNVPYSRYVLRRYLSECRNDIYADGQLRLMMETPDHHTAGIADLADYSPRHGRAEVGIVVLPPYRHRGLAREALRLLARYADVHLAMTQLYAYVAEANEPAKRLFRAAGYDRECLLDGWLHAPEGPADARLFRKML